MARSTEGKVMGNVLNIMDAYDLVIDNVYNSNGTIKTKTYSSNSASQYYMIREYYTYRNGNLIKVARKYHKKN